MSSTYKKTNKLLALLIIYLASCTQLFSQENVLDNTLKLKLRNVKRQQVLNAITHQTAYVFTFDTELIKPSEIVSVGDSSSNIRQILDSIFEGESFEYAVIENHIIIFKKLDLNTPMIREFGKRPVYLITGSIFEKGSVRALPFATIGIYNKGIGTIANNDGYFSLKVRENTLNDSLRVSYLGFKDRIIPVSQAVENHFNVELTPEIVPIPEVLIRNREPHELLNGIQKNKRKNYGNTPVILTAFYREAVSNKDKIQLYSEAILNIYKASYFNRNKSDQISVYKSRKFENINSTDTLVLKLQAGLDAIFALDGIKTNFDFLSSENYSDYTYRMTDIVNIGDDAAYLIEFEQIENINDLALFSGSLYVNTSDYGLHTAEFEINPKYVHLITKSFIKESSKQFKVNLKSVKYRVDYRKIKSRYYLNHVRGDIKLYARGKRKLFGNSFNIMFEMAVNNIDSINVEKFKRDELAPRYSIFSETIKDYDINFWGTGNFLQPEVKIEEAIQQLNIKLGPFKRKD